MWCMYTLEYYSAKESEILPFATSRMDLEDIMLSETGEKKTNNIWPHFFVESKNQTNKTKLIDMENRLVAARGGVRVNGIKR